MAVRLLALFAYCALLFFATVSWTLSTLTSVPPWMAFIVHPLIVLGLAVVAIALVVDGARHPEVTVALFASAGRLLPLFKIAGFTILASLVTVAPLWWKSAESVQRASSASDRFFLPPDIDAKYLIALYQYNPAADADKLAGNFIGRWMRVNSTVDALENRNDQRELVFVNGITMAFAPRWIGKLSLFSRGARISAVGKVDYIDRLGVHLSECELVAE